MSHHRVFCSALCLTTLLFTAVVAGEAPADLPGLFKQQAEWTGALKGLHVRYRTKFRVDSSYIRANLPALDVYYEAVLETWISADGKTYRYETGVDQASLAKARETLAKAVGVPVAKLSPKAFLLLCGNRILVRSGTRSEELTLDSGRLAIRWTSTVPMVTVDGVPPPPLHEDRCIQPLLASCFGHWLRPDGIFISGELFAAVPPLAGVHFSATQRQVQPDGAHASLSAQIVLGDGAAARPPLHCAVDLQRIGSDPTGRWFVERMAMNSDSVPGAVNGYTTITWKPLPKTAWVAVPERITRMMSGSRVLSDTVAEIIEVANDLPKKMWTIDPLLAKTIVDETAGMEIEPATP